MIDPYAVTRTLSQHRPVFHSEADFQHAFAWQLHMDYPHLKIRLEYPFYREDDTTDHIDIVAFDDNETIAFELKYKTALFFMPSREDVFYLKGHSAQDLGRYDFLKDIHRLEKFVTEYKNSSGYAILLTNDGAYWNPSSKAKSVCDQFRLTDQRLITGELSWSETAGKGTIKGREARIKLKGSYTCIWRDYSEFEKSEFIKGSGKFRCLVIKIA
ncbi:MAG: hypothetical protein ACETVW_05545 [Dehalococcoidia bacterium]